MPTINLMMEAMEAAPRGTSGLCVVPWCVYDVYGVAANWANAAAPVYTWGDGEWINSGRQVADYRHDPQAALVDILRIEIEAGDPDEDAHAEAQTLAAGAVSFG